MTQELLELAERCEKATGPDAYLDLDIFKAATDVSWRDIASLTDAAAYTASLDSAMTLVPEGYYAMVMNAHDGKTGPVVGGGLAIVADVSSERGIADAEPLEAATPALALCAAALRARCELS